MSNKLHLSFSDTIGDTPIVRLNNVTTGLGAEIFLKCEFRNPLFSIKDLVARAMLEDAEATGQLKPGALIVEPTSGNTGIALAALATAKGYKCCLVMPESMSLERRTLLRMLGAEVVITPASAGMAGSIAVADKILAETPGAFSPRQFDNPANPAAHYKVTGPKIWEATEGTVDAFVASVGTGGTISGTMKFLKEKNPAIRGIAVEPATSAVLSGGKPGTHGIQGIGAGFVPKNYDASVVDEIIPVDTEDAFAISRLVASKEGIPIGISSGATVCAALRLAARPEYSGKRIVAIAASTTERYLSTPLAAVAAKEMKELRTTPLPE